MGVFFRRHLWKVVVVGTWSETMNEGFESERGMEERERSLIWTKRHIGQRQEEITKEGKVN